MMLDPFGPWPTQRRVIWLLVALVVGLQFGPRLIHALKPGPHELFDFYQEWSSARNVALGRSAYSPVEDHLEEYIGLHVPAGAKWWWNINPHPPTSVALAMPLQGFDYPTAFFVWNISSLLALAVSVWLVISGMGIRFSAWSSLPVVSVLLASDPLFQQVAQGQLNLFLLLLLVGIWSSTRRDRPIAAGAFLALAAAIKLFPGFILLYFLVRRQWRAVCSAAISFGLVTAATCLIVGTRTYHTYLTQVLPGATSWKAVWNNASIAGFWYKLFDPSGRDDRLSPLFLSPTLATTGTLVCVAIVVALLVRTILKSRSQRDADLAMGLTIVAMLLASPVTWEHYFLLLLVPLVVIWVHLPRKLLAQLMLPVIVLALCAPIIWLCNLMIPGGFFEGTASAIHAVTLFSFQFYALLALFGLGIYCFAQPVDDGVATNAD